MWLKYWEVTEQEDKAWDAFTLKNPEEAGFLMRHSGGWTEAFSKARQKWLAFRDQFLSVCVETTPKEPTT
jgi:hypothetical protein